MINATADQLAQAKAIADSRYVDPHPGMKGTDTLRFDCGSCVNGVYTGPSGWHWDKGGVDTTWCFQCDGAGNFIRKVSNIRAQVRRNLKSAALAEILADQYVALAAERAAEELAADHEAAIIENDRRNSLVQGFIGEAGDKIKNVEGTVDVATRYESDFGYSSSYNAFLVIKLDSGHFVKTGGSGRTLFAPAKGDRVVIKGATVKGHDHFNGQDQTALTRVRLEVLEVVEVG